MRVIIVPSDGMVSVDGEDYREIDLSFMSEIHAVQWYDSFGEVELSDQYMRSLPGYEITSLEPFQLALDRWQERKIAKLNEFPATPIIEG
jgi:hypothetical protein